MDDYFTLLDYRRGVADLYAWLRASGLPPAERLAEFRRRRDELIGSHPQSALDAEQRAIFPGLRYFGYNPALRFECELDRAVQPEAFELPLQDDGTFRMQRFGRVHFEVAGQAASLAVYWVLGYGGGLFLPFRDDTNQSGETYGGGRYLLDSIKSADLGQAGDRLVLDFNYAYNPSCAYHYRWHCPLAPPENWLAVRIEAGEMTYPDPR
ncbi:MAG: DUF1684 domain-containing protein [Chloroflexi bacterium]|nr:DUF1684 domain-containing protein [Chloroflexota bacterium]